MGFAAVPPAGAQRTAGGDAGAAAAVDAGAMVRDLSRAYDEGAEDSAKRRWQANVGRNRMARALMEGTLARLAFHYDDADRHYQLAVTDTTGRVGAWALLGQAAVTVSRGGYRAAMQSFEQAASRLDRLGDRRGQGEALIGQALAVLRVVGVDSARTVLRTAGDIVPADDLLLRARWQCATLLVRTRAGERVADSTFTRVEREVAVHGNRVLAECLFTRAQYLESIGLAVPARNLLDTVATLQAAARLWHALSATRQWQGTTHLSRGNHGLARLALDEALAYAQRGASVNGEAWALQELGRVSQRVGATGDAHRYFSAARPRFEASGDEIGMLYADRALADAALLRRDFHTADSLYVALGSRVERLAPQQRVAVLVARSDLARRRGNPPASAQLLDSAARLARARNLPGWTAEIRYQRGLVALAEGQVVQAIAQWDTLLQQQNLRSPVRFEALSRRAEAQSLAGDFAAAWRTFGSAKLALDRWSTSLRRREDVLAALQDRNFDWDRDLGLATMIARFAAAGHNPEALALAEWRRVRGKEQAALQRGALHVDVSRPVGVALRGVDTSALDPRRLPTLARGRLPATTAIVSYVVGYGNEPTTAFIVTRDTVRSIPLPGIDSLVSPIERFVAFLRAGQRPEALAQSLSGAVLAPVVAALPGDVSRLVIVPDGELHRLPFAALPHPAGDPLIVHVELALAPSVEDALGGVASLARAATGRGRTQAVLVGAPTPMPRMPETTAPWPDLPGARAEVRVVNELLHDAFVLGGAQVTRAALMDRLAQGGRLLHVATHAVSDPTSFLRTGLVIAPSKGDQQTGLIDLPTLASQPMPFDLVVLSACSSGEGVLLTGQALHGLVSTALDAGARGVVATRWRVDDAAIVPHIRRFYEILLQRGDVVAAVHEVRLAAMRAGVSPAIWANLEYFGDPTLRVVLTPREPTAWSHLSGTWRRWLRALRGDHL